MSSLPQPTPFEVHRRVPGGGLVLRGEQDARPDASGPPLLLLHGLSATRRNVLQGSRHLARRGYRLIAYDARGHGESDPPPDPGAYEYADLVGDAEAVLDELGVERAVLVGSSMGAATATAFALEHPDRVRALVLITPAYTGVQPTAEDRELWEEAARTLELEGLEEFARRAVPPELPERWRTATEEATRQRLGRHRDLDAIVAALRVVPGSRAFDGFASLEAIDAPVLVVGSRDETDGLHPFEVADEYFRRLPRGELAVEQPDESPLAWRGAALSRTIEDFLTRAGLSPEA